MMKTLLMGEMDSAWETTNFFPEVYYSQGTDEEPRNSHERAISSITTEAEYQPRFFTQQKSDGQHLKRKRVSEVLIIELE